MSDPDYLWDKEGSDPEVEKLEQSLGGLKYSRKAPKLDPKPSRAPREERPPPQPRPAQRWDKRMPIVAGLVLAMVGGAMGYSAIETKKASVRRGWNLVPVVVATRDVPEGTEVTMDMISQRSVPEQFVTSSVVKPDSASYIVNQKTLVPLQAGDPLLWSGFETTKAAERLATRVQKKARAITIDAGRSSSVGGWIRPNDHVDIIGTFKDPNTNESVAVTLMQNVVILATGKITGTTNTSLIPEGQREYNNVSLLVVPEEAELLVLAAELGALTLTLRNDDDVDVIEEKGRATINTLLSGERTRVLQQKRFNTIQVIRGATGEDIKLQAAPEK